MGGGGAGGRGTPTSRRHNTGILNKFYQCSFFLVFRVEKNMFQN